MTGKNIGGEGRMSKQTNLHTPLRPGESMSDQIEMGSMPPINNLTEDEPPETRKKTIKKYEEMLERCIQGIHEHEKAIPGLPRDYNALAQLQQMRDELLRRIDSLKNRSR